MSEEGGFWGRVGRALGVRRGDVSTGPESEVLSPKQKAQQAFYDAEVQSLTPDQLQSVADFEPPHSIFDLSRLGDRALFRVLITTKVTREQWEPQFFEKYTYGCVAFDEGHSPQLYITEHPPEKASESQYLMRAVHSVEDLEDHSPEMIDVRRIEFEKPDLSWDEPFSTLPGEFFTWHLTAGKPTRRRFEVTLHKIEIVSGGNPVTHKPSQAENMDYSSASEPGLAPQLT